MENLVRRLKHGEILIADGAMGTMLMERGLKPGEPPESFNLTHPEVLEDIAKLYFEAGADIIQTNTFGASPVKLSLYSMEDKTDQINRAAVCAVKKVIGEQAYVSASCGPCGRLLKPYGDIEQEEVYNSFVEQIQIISDEGVDIICIETMTDLTEAVIALKAAKTAAPSIPVIVTMTFDPTPKGFYTIMGTDIATAATELEHAGADIIGSNCGNGIENMIAIAEEFKQKSKLPIIIQSNAGMPEIKGNRAMYPETPRFMAERVKKLVSLGVSIIGGCCGTTPEHITAIKRAVELMRCT
jgi:5-methyltetrahydrofolate--homocysteine methyltransferase